MLKIGKSWKCGKSVTCKDTDFFKVIATVEFSDYRSILNVHCTDRQTDRQREWTKNQLLKSYCVNVQTRGDVLVCS